MTPIFTHHHQIIITLVLGPQLYSSYIATYAVIVEFVSHTPASNPHNPPLLSSRPYPPRPCPHYRPQPYLHSIPIPYPFSFVLLEYTHTSCHLHFFVPSRTLSHISQEDQLMADYPLATLHPPLTPACTTYLYSHFILPTHPRLFFIHLRPDTNPKKRNETQIIINALS